MLRRIALGTLIAFPLGAQPVRKDPPSPNVARFDWFQYEGHDPVFDQTRPKASEYQNPILAGFYPDPSLTRAGDDYYIVNSTFAYFPGIPVFHSKDLVNWTQIGNVIDRPTQLNFDGLGISRGVFAPAISHHDGVFYVINTCVDCGGNFVVTATNPAGPWSDPIWLREIDGIDPSMFFDDDGKAYIINNGPPIGTPLYGGHRAIWIQEWDIGAKKLVGPRTLIVNGGVDISTKPSWIEGPHLLKRQGRYYLIAAEGGTGDYHSEVVFGSDSVRGPYTPSTTNPILTQRHLDRNRPSPITSTGHADFVQTPSGDWWSIFLGTRPYAPDTYNTGRETFMLPVRWENGWPVITPGTQGVSYATPRPALAPQPAVKLPTTGNFVARDEFDGSTLASYWMQMRTPRESTFSLAAGSLSLRARSVDIGDKGQPSFVGRRQQHIDATASTAMRYTPMKDGDKAGLVAFQAERFYYALVVSRAAGKPVVQLLQRAGRATNDAEVVVATVPLDAVPNAPVYLQIVARGAAYDFFYATKRGAWKPVKTDADGTILSTRVAGGFVGTMLGMYAYAAP